MVVFGDDGEKFGTWPETNKHVYDDGWLERFFDALVENQDWIQTTTLAEAFDNVPPVGKIYLPDSSYREMTEWALPAEQQVEYEQICARDGATIRAGRRLRGFVRGGFWRNFKVKYPESNEMYCPDDDGQPPAAERAKPPRRGEPSTPSWSNRPARSCTAASATAATGTGPSAGSTCRICATPSIST